MRKARKEKWLPLFDLTRQLKHYFGFDAFKGDQEAIIQNLLDGHDTFVLMPTGGGKSMCYQLPALLMRGTAIVISPLISLMKNQVDAIRLVSEDNGVAHYLNSSLSRAAIEEVKRDVISGRTKLLYVAPESLTKDENVQFLRGVQISFYAVDEAHCISEWGHDFRPEYRRIRDLVNDIGVAPIIALTATATDKVRGDIKKILGITDAREFKSSFNRPNLYYEVRPKTREVDKEIIRYIKQNAGKSGIVYCLSRKRVEELAEVLRANDITAQAYHAGMDAAARAQAQDDFLMERTDVIVATIAFGMGIDKPDVRFVIHYDIPKSLEGYYQETGRAGRDGGEGRCITFYARRDLQKLEKFMEGKPVAEQDIGRQILAETAAYAESSVCRRRMLLHYFGEKYMEDNCCNCDNCLNPKTRIEAGADLQKALRVVQAVKENFKATHIIDVLVGNDTEDVLVYGHEKLKVYGTGEGHTETYWGAVIRHAMLAGYLVKEVEDYGVLKLTDMGRAFIKKPDVFYISEDNEYEDDFDDGVSVTEGTSSGDEALYAILHDLRRDVARKQDVPPYVIFQDPSLSAMTLMYPCTLDEMKAIPGVGAAKAARYGKAFCDVIKRYVEENEIERPEDMLVRTLPNQSKNKVAIISAIDHQVTLDDLAYSKGLTMASLIEEMESIVYSGTKLRIGYYIESIMDEDHMLDIYDYFRGAASDNIADALKTLGEDFTEEEVRLVRLKFLSELAM